LDLVEELDTLNNLIRKKPHERVSDVLVLADELSAGITCSGKSLDAYSTYLIFDLKRTGVLVDIFRTSDIKNINLSRYKLIVFSYDFRLNTETLNYVKERSDATIMFQYMAGCVADGNFSFKNIENVTGFSLRDNEEKTNEMYPTVKINNNVLYETEKGSFAERVEDGRTLIMNTIPKISIEELKNIVKKAGCHIYIDADYTLYGDNRFLTVIASDKEFSGLLDFGKVRSWKKHGTNETGKGKQLHLTLKPYETAVFLFN